MNRQPSAPATVRGVAEETAFERLVIEQLTQLQRGHAEIKAEIVAVGTVADSLRLELASVKRETEQGFAGTHERLDISNGRHDKNEDRIRALEGRNQDAAIAARARQQQRQEDREKVEGALAAAKAAWPLALEVLIGAGVIWVALWGLF